MSSDYYTDMLNIAAEIKQLELIENSLGRGSEWKQAKQRFEQLEGAFISLRDEFTDALLRDGQDWSAVPHEVETVLNDFEADSGDEWYPAFEYLREQLIPYVTRESKRSPWYRKTMAWSSTVIFGGLIVAYFGVATFSGVRVDQPIDSKPGIIQRAEAFQNAARYTDLMNSRVRRGGWIKSLLFWPIKPSEREFLGSGEFLGLTLQGYKALKENGSICGHLAIGYGDRVSDEELDLAHDVADYVQQTNVQWQEPAVLTTLVPIQRAYPCL